MAGFILGAPNHAFSTVDLTDFNLANVSVNIFKMFPGRCKKDELTSASKCVCNHGWKGDDCTIRLCDRCGAHGMAELSSEALIFEFDTLVLNTQELALPMDEAAAAMKGGEGTRANFFWSFAFLIFI